MMHYPAGSSHQKIGTLSGVVVPGELGILLIYAPDFFLMARQRMKDLCHNQ